jgi:hypothetical protein
LYILRDKTAYGTKQFIAFKEELYLMFKEEN